MSSSALALSALIKLLNLHILGTLGLGCMVWSGQVGCRKVEAKVR